MARRSRLSKPEQALKDLEGADGKGCGTREQRREILLCGGSFLSQLRGDLAAGGLHGLQFCGIGGRQQIFGAEKTGVDQLVGRLMAAEELAIVEPVESFAARVAGFGVE